MRSTLCLAVLLAMLSLSYAQFKIPCGFAYTNGTYVSLESLAGNYYFVNPNVTGNNNNYPQPAGNISAVEVAICQAVDTQNSALCTNTNSAVNVIYNNSVCLSAGEANVAGWDLNPSTEGGSLVYYHGASTSHVNELSTRIYFECGTQTNLTYEFFSSNYTQFHLVITTPAVCVANAVSPPTPTPNVVACTTTFQGQTVDLSPLKAANGSYLFTNINNMTGINFEVQVCDNVKSSYTNCTIPSPANLVNTNTGVCTPVGDINAYAWALNPASGAGVNLILYHGAQQGLVGTLQTRIYFECSSLYAPKPGEPTLPLEQLVWEHYSPVSGNGGSYHLVIETNYSCPAFPITATTAGTTTTTTNTVSGTTTTTTNAASGTTTTTTNAASGTTTTTTTNAGSGTTTTTSPASFVAPCIAVAAAALALFFL